MISPLRFAFLVNHLGPSQLAYHILQQGHQHRERIDVDFLVFHQQSAQTWETPHFALMDMSELYNYTGATIATCWETAHRLLVSPGSRQKYFYMWNLEWTYKYKPYQEYSEIYQNKKLTILSRNDYHAKIFTECWNRPVDGIVKNCDIPTLTKLIQQRKTNGT